uniref:Uncharacterized protein n=1 Tax=Anguilla anguilla TaxID=7936 RepID=A0A0E9QUA7_ANGAN
MHSSLGLAISWYKRAISTDHWSPSITKWSLYVYLLKVVHKPP